MDLFLDIVLGVAGLAVLAWVLFGDLLVSRQSSDCESNLRDQ